MRLSERPVPTSSASLLSLANAFAALSGGDDSKSLGPHPSNAKEQGYLDGQTRGESGSRATRGARSETAPPSSDEDTVKLVKQMRDKLSLGDYTGALEAAESLLDDPTFGAEASRSADACRDVLEKMYAARIGPLQRVPRVVVPREQLRWLSIDHRAGFVLSHIDGVSSFEMILDVSGMPALDALRILHRLLQERIIAIR